MPLPSFVEGLNEEIQFLFRNWTDNLIDHVPTVSMNGEAVWIEILISFIPIDRLAAYTDVLLSNSFQLNSGMYTPQAQQKGTCPTYLMIPSILTGLGVVCAVERSSDFKGDVNVEL